MKGKSIYIFDWDGCLADTLSSWMESYQEVYLSYGFCLKPSEVVETSFGKYEQGPRNVGIGNYQKAMDEIIQVVKLKLEKPRLNPGAKQILGKLKNLDKKIAIVSSSKKAVLSKSIPFTGLDKFIDLVIADDDVEKRKPNPEAIFMVLNHFQSSPENAVIIGDSHDDIKAGKSAGISTVLYFSNGNSDYYKKEDLLSLNPDSIIKNFGELEY